MINNLFIIFIILIILILLFFINKYLISINNYEHFCKIPKVDNQGSNNDKNVLLNYPPQSNILTSSCNRYW